MRMFSSMNIKMQSIVRCLAHTTAYEEKYLGHQEKIVS
jgi:hypothetical protein